MFHEVRVPLNVIVMSIDLMLLTMKSMKETMTEFAITEGETGVLGPTITTMSTIPLSSTDNFESTTTTGSMISSAMFNSGNSAGGVNEERLYNSCELESMSSSYLPSVVVGGGGISSSRTTVETATALRLKQYRHELHATTKQMKRATSTMMHILDTVLSFEKIGSSTFELRMKPFIVTDFVEQIILAFESQVKGLFIVLCLNYRFL